MATYMAVTTSNEFRVKDDKKFEEFMSKVVTNDWDTVEFAKHNVGLYSFGCYGEIAGYRYTPENNEGGLYDENDYDYAEMFDKFIEGLQGLVADDDAIIITEVGHEKLSYCDGYIVIITSNDIKIELIHNIGNELAREMLNKNKR